MAWLQCSCRQVDTNKPLDAMLLRLNPALRGCCAYFRPGVSAATFRLQQMRPTKRSVRSITGGLAGGSRPRTYRLISKAPASPPKPKGSVQALVDI